MKFTKRITLTITLFLSGTSARGLSLFTEVAKRSRRTGTVPGLLLPLFAMFALLWTTPLFAGNLDSPGPPGSGSGMPTLQGIYDRLDTGAFPNISGGFAEPSAGPGATGVSLGNITTVLPRPDNTNGLAPSEAMSGKTFWGLRTDGTWGPQTGNNANVVDTSSGDTLAGDMLSGKKAWVDGSEVTGNVPVGSNVTGSDGNLVITITDGLYSGSKTTTAQDADLATGNIKSGVNIFGVAGDSNVVNTSTGDAVSADLLNGKKAWVDGVEVAGSRLSAPPAMVAASGQTISYAKGDDGRFYDNGDGTVADNLTGLVWLKNADCAGGLRNWATALTDVDSLNGAGTMNSNGCGDTSNGGSHQTDWRLPNLNELESLIDAGQSSPALPIGHPFTSVQAAGYWSATTYAAGSIIAWVVDLIIGYVHLNGKTDNGYVWSVRAGQ